MDDKQNEALELFSVYAGTIAQNESKRLQANATYMGFAGVLVTAGATVDDANILVLAIVGLLLSIIWFFTIQYHRNLAHAKFDALKELEDTLIFQPFQKEWKKYKQYRWRLSLTQIETTASCLVGLSSLIILTCELL